MGTIKAESLPMIQCRKRAERNQQINKSTNNNLRIVLPVEQIDMGNNAILVGNIIILSFGDESKITQITRRIF